MAPTPNGLGTYFSNLVETVIQKRSNSRAALVEEVKRQYIKQIETAEKQNLALREQIEKMTKASAEAQANFKTQSDALTKQLATQQDELKKMNEANADQVKNFNGTISEMQKTNAALQDSVRKLTEQNAQASADFNSASKQVQELTRRLENSRNGKVILIAISVVSIMVAVVMAFI